MIVTRLSKTVLVAAIALFATLVAFGNITDYGTNWPFVQHVLAMDTIFPDSTIKYRAVENNVVQIAAYVFIIVLETVTAVLCWIGVFHMAGHLGSKAKMFNRSKAWAIGGLTLGFLVWQVGFMSIGGEWFGMWMSQQWNGVPDAFRFLMTIIAVLIFVTMPDTELQG